MQLNSLRNIIRVNVHFQLKLLSQSKSSKTICIFFFKISLDNSKRQTQIQYFNCTSYICTQQSMTHNIVTINQLHNQLHNSFILCCTYLYVIHTLKYDLHVFTSTSSYLDIPAHINRRTKISLSLKAISFILVLHEVRVHYN